MILSLRHSTVLIFLAMILVFSCKQKEQVSKTVKKETNKKKQNNAPTQTAKGKKQSEEDWYLKIGITKKQMHQSTLYSFIDDWYGTPYKYSGCNQSGVDCSCFTNICYEKVYGKKIARSANELFAACDKISLNEAEEGDLVFFKIGGNKISHVGIYLKKKYFVHASTSMGVTINSLDEAYYKKYFFCAGKMKSV